jgi:FkbM family methyltransferase
MDILLQSEKRDHQLSIKTYHPLISEFLCRYYRWIDHPSKLRILRYLEMLLGERRIVATTIYGFLMAVDKNDLIQRHILYERLWESDLSILLAQELTEEDIFLDIGANVGYFTCFALAHQVKQVIACEPDPLNCEILTSNLNLNGFDYKKVILLEKGLGRSQGRLTFNRSHVANTGVSGFNACNAVATFEVEVDTLDNLIDCGNIPAPTVVKMDVEGWEEQVLRGAFNLLQHQPPRLIIFEAICDADGVIINQKLVEILRNFGFVITQSLLSDYGCNHVAKFSPV